MDDLQKLGTFADVPCMRCGTIKGVLWEPARTAYYWDGTGEDPNAPLPLCGACEQEHTEYWDHMWAEYYSGLL